MRKLLLLIVAVSPIAALTGLALRPPPEPRGDHASANPRRDCLTTAQFRQNQAPALGNAARGYPPLCPAPGALALEA